MQTLVTAGVHFVNDAFVTLGEVSLKGPLSKLQFLVDLVDRSRQRGAIDEILRHEPGFLLECDISLEGVAVVFETTAARLVIYDLRRMGLKPHGYLYGYPECCIVWQKNRYLRDNDPFVRTEFTGTGYVPCPACRQRQKDELIDDINSRRLAPLPFPDGAHLHDLALIGFLLKHDLPIGDNLATVKAEFPDYNYGALFINKQ